MQLKNFTLRNSHGMEVHFTNLGGTVTRIIFQGVNVVVPAPESYGGAIIGRVANRIRNAQFKLDGVQYHLYQNDGKNSLHGGKTGFDKVFWDVQEKEGRFHLSHLSPDGEEGYPGNLKVDVTYSLTEKNEFVMEYLATTDKPTHVNLTNHCYFNLSGKPGTTILDHELTIFSDHYTEADSAYIPTGKILPAEGPVNFRTPKAVGRDISFSKDGYNQNYLVKGNDVVARLSHSGRTLEVLTTEPAVMFYSGHYLPHAYEGLALEAQHYPDSPNRTEFPSTELRPGQKYYQKTIYRLK